MKLHFRLLSQRSNITLFLSFTPISSLLHSPLLLLNFPLLLDFLRRTFLFPNALPRPNYSYSFDEQTHLIVNFIFSLGICNRFQVLVPYLYVTPALPNTSSYTLRGSAVTIQRNSTAGLTGTSSSTL